MTPPDTPSDRCAWCGKSETPDATPLPIGVGLRHAWLHRYCWAPWRDQRRAKAEDDFARLGVVRPLLSQGAFKQHATREIAQP
jgi:hypothetical protein